MGNISSVPVEESSPPMALRRNWMGELIKREPEKFGNLKLHMVAFPGSHNSATYEVESLPFSTLAQCQRYDLTRQLYSGVRFLDLRVGDDTYDGILRIAHRFLCTSVSQALHQIYQFLVENPDEIVMVGIKKDWDRQLSSQGKDKLIKLVNLYFEKLIITEEEFTNLTINELVKSNKRIQIISQELEDTDIPTNKMISSWNETNSSTIEELIEKLETHKVEEKTEYLQVLDCYLTPDAESIAKWSLKNVNWHQLQEDANKRIFEWLKKKTEKENSFNVIAIDMVSQEIIDHVIDLNPNPKYS